MYNDMESKEPNSGLKAFGAISDITSARMGYPWFKFGHKTSYWKQRKTGMGSELFAEYFEYKATQQKGFNISKDVFPESVKQIDKILADALNDLL